jgi:hypothetical protein
VSKLPPVDEPRREFVVLRDPEHGASLPVERMTTGDDGLVAEIEHEGRRWCFSHSEQMKDRRGSEEMRYVFVLVHERP